MDVEEIHKELIDNMFKMLLAGLITKKVKLLSILPFAESILERRL
jgi:hypothetical protein